jgi:pantoate--beta-alanine ligase
MGYFHQGHLALMKRAGELSDKVVVSIFVNPTQFGPNEDLDKYPRAIERDLELAAEAGVDLVFMPEPEELYPPGFQTWVSVEGLSKGLCGASRPGHFRGVATIVAKLFNIVQPDLALFGEKDYQQLQVIRRMAKDLDFPVQIVDHPTVREADGLAMSSRNSYLNPSQRKSALCLKKALDLAETLIRGGEDRPETVTGAMKELISAYPETRIDYIFIGDPDGLEPLDEISGRVFVALAVFVGDTRLIDNRVISPEE